MPTQLQRKPANADALAFTPELEARLRQLAPKWIKPERIFRLIMSARSRNPAIAQASKASVLLFCAKCAETGLEPIGAGGAWAVPFKNNKTNEIELTFIPDWRGLISLAKRTRQIKHAYGEVVKERDIFDIEKGDSPRVSHKYALVNRGETIGAYCVCILPDGEKHIEWMNREELDAIQERSKAKDSGPWKTDPDQMRIKTVVRRALKPFASSPEMQAAIDADNRATGYEVAIEREPVMMPRARMIEAEAEDVTPPPAKKSSSAEQAGTTPVAATDAGESEPTIAPAPASTSSAAPQPAQGFRREAPTKESSIVCQVAKLNVKDTARGGKKFSFNYDGAWYSTFDTKIGDMLQQAERERFAVHVVFKPNANPAYGNDIVRVEDSLPPGA